MKQTLKSGQKYRINADDCELLQVEDNLVLSKIVGPYGATRYDISSAQIDSAGDEVYRPSMNANGLVEVDSIAGSQKTPRSLEEMTEKFTTIVEGNRKSAESKKKAAQEREEAFSSRAWKINVAKDLRAEAEKTIFDVMSTSKSIERAVADPRLKSAVETAEIISKILPYIR